MLLDKLTNNTKSQKQSSNTEEPISTHKYMKCQCYVITIIYHGHPVFKIKLKKCIWKKKKNTYEPRHSDIYIGKW